LFCYWAKTLCIATSAYLLSLCIVRMVLPNAHLHMSVSMMCISSVPDMYSFLLVD
jgi:hypothetical protein